MKVITVQSRYFIDRYLEGKEKPSLSEFRLKNRRSTFILKKYMFPKLREIGWNGVDGFFWGWVKNPYLDFQRDSLAYDSEKMDMLCLDLPSNRLVLSDFDEWERLLLKERNGYVSDFEEEQLLWGCKDIDCGLEDVEFGESYGKAIQCCFLEFKKGNIVWRRQY